MKFNNFRIAVFLSSSSMAFGILREFLIIGLLGFSSSNDKLQLYLSVFYTIGLTIDAMRLACLNLYTVLSLPRILLCASAIGLPFSFIIGFVLSLTTGGLNLPMLLITILGGFLNLIAALLITYKQRENLFLPAQVINVLPNLILIPGILLCYWTARDNLIFAIVSLTSLIPVVQCILLLLLTKSGAVSPQQNTISLLSGIFTFSRHFLAMISEQFYQILLRSAFYKYGTGYLSMFAIAARIYSAARFILVDSFIGSKLANWKHKLQDEDDLAKYINLTLVNFLIACVALVISLKVSTNFNYSSLQISAILICGFSLSTLARIVYFKINHQQNNPVLVMRFALLEFVCLLMALLLTQQVNYSVLTLLWIGYVAKSFGQLLLLRKYYYDLALNYGLTDL